MLPRHIFALCQRQGLVWLRVPGQGGALAPVFGSAHAHVCRGLGHVHGQDHREGHSSYFCISHFASAAQNRALSRCWGIRGGFCDGVPCTYPRQGAAWHCQPIRAREPCKSIDLPEPLLSPAYPISEAPRTCLNGFPCHVCVAAGAQGHNTSSPCLGKTVLMGEKTLSPFLQSRAPSPGAFSVRYCCFDGRHGKIHAGTSPPLQLHSLLAVWGLPCFAMGTLARLRAP